MVIDAAFIIAILLTGNIMLTNGFSALELQRNKSNLWFALLNTFCNIMVIMAATSLYSIIYKYILDLYNVEKIGLLIIVLLAGAGNFGILQIIKSTNKEMYYYYDATYSFVINLALTIGVLLNINFSLSFGDTIIYTAFVCLAYVAISLLFAFIYPRLHNQKISKVVRPVPITILAMSVLMLILYAIKISI